MTGGHTFNEVFFTDVRIPAANLVGDLNDGWRLAKVTLGNERISLSSGGVLWGNGPTALDLVEAAKAAGPVTDPCCASGWPGLRRAHRARADPHAHAVGSAEGRAARPEASIRKLLGDEHGQHVMALARDLIGAAAMLTGGDGSCGRRRRVRPGTETKNLGPSGRRGRSTTPVGTTATCSPRR